MLRAIDPSPLAVAKRLGSHGENALANVNRKTLRMRLAKICFRLKPLFCWRSGPTFQGKVGSF